MCSAPYLILNPHFQNPSHKGSTGAELNINKYSNLYDTMNKFLAVPCGHCYECKQISQAYITQRARLEIQDSYCYFITLTYQNSAIPVINLQGYKHYYADIRDFQLFIKRLRKRSELSPWTSKLSDKESLLKYLCVTEYGGERHRPHFHALLFFRKSLFDDSSLPTELELILESLIKDEWKRRIGGTSFEPIYEPLSKFIKNPDGTGTYDCHLVTENYGNSDDPADVAFYVSKYVLKYDKWIENKRGMLWHNYREDYKKLWALFRPKMLLSKGFGITENTKDFITRCILMSKKFKTIVPQFFTEDGVALPLSRYYQQKYMKVSDKAFFIANNPNAYIPEGCSLPVDATQNVKILSPSDIFDFRAKSSHFQKICDKLYNDSDAFLTLLDCSDACFDEVLDFNIRGVPDDFFDSKKFQDDIYQLTNFSDDF